MKLISKLAVAVLSVSGALLCAAEVTNYSVKDISRILGKNVTFKENSVVCNGQSMLVGKKIIEIDPAKKYTFKFTAVGNAEKSTRLFAGFAMLDAQGRSTEAQHWQGYQDTLTEVAAPAKKGDTVLKVKNGAKWRKGNYFTIACNAKADLSDIPNGSNIAENITDVKKVGDVWEITVKRPLRSDVAAGTLIRQHARGGYLYIAPIKTVPKNGQIEVKGSLKGIAKTPVFRAPTWPVNAKKARWIILADWTGAKADVEIKDISITVE